MSVEGNLEMLIFKESPLFLYVSIPPGPHGHHVPDLAAAVASNECGHIIQYLVSHLPSNKRFYRIRLAIPFRAQVTCIAGTGELL
jgi:hypothetical protein